MKRKREWIDDWIDDWDYVLAPKCRCDACPSLPCRCKRGVSYTPRCRGSGVARICLGRWEICMHMIFDNNIHNFTQNSVAIPACRGLECAISLPHLTQIIIYSLFTALFVIVFIL